MMILWLKDFLHAVKTSADLLNNVLPKLVALSVILQIKVDLEKAAIKLNYTALHN